MKGVLIKKAVSVLKHHIRCKRYLHVSLYVGIIQRPFLIKKAVRVLKHHIRCKILYLYVSLYVGIRTYKEWPHPLLRRICHRETRPHEAATRDAAQRISLRYPSQQLIDKKALQRSPNPLISIAVYTPALLS